MAVDPVSLAHRRFSELGGVFSQIDLGDFGHTFLPGHRIRVEISSSYVPMFSPNSNTGNPVATDLESQIAKQTIFHTRTAASYIALPINR